MDFHTHITNKCLKWAEAPSSQDNYYHFTKAIALESINNSKNIWASHVKNLQRNDKDEFYNGLNLFKDVVERRKFQELFAEFFKYLDREIAVGNLNLFILSTTKLSNSLEHIKNYGENDTNNFITINSPYVFQNNKFTGNEILFSLDVIYDDQEKARLMNVFLDEFENALDVIYRYNPNLVAKKSPEIGQVFLASLQVVVIYCSIFKNSRYHWENEHRFVVYRIGRTKRFISKQILKIS